MAMAIVPTARGGVLGIICACPFKRNVYANTSRLSASWTLDTPLFVQVACEDDSERFSSPRSERIDSSRIEILYFTFDLNLTENE